MGCVAPDTGELHFIVAPAHRSGVTTTAVPLRTVLFAGIVLLTAAAATWGPPLAHNLVAAFPLEAHHPPDVQRKSNAFLDEVPKDKREPAPPPKVRTRTHCTLLDATRTSLRSAVGCEDHVLHRQTPQDVPFGPERGPMGVLWALPVLASLLFTLRQGMLGILRSPGPAVAAPGGNAPPFEGLPRLPWRPEGWSFWEWRGPWGTHAIHYVACKPKADPALPRKAPIVLVHGFGASLHHWRHNIAALATGSRPVYALDLLGFGLSAKPPLAYDAIVWRDQLAAFIRSIVGEPAVLVGNSLGGFAVLSCAAHYPQLAKAVVLLNIAGRFESDVPPDDIPEEDEDPSPLDMVLDGMQRLLNRPATGPLDVAKQPTRIRAVLSQLYITRTNVDAELVESIAHATRGVTAPEVYHSTLHSDSPPAPRGTVDSLLAVLNKSYRPLLLLWGEMDPWIRPHTGNAIQRIYPRAERISLAAGHCPHDELPGTVNAELLAWLQRQRL